MSLSLSRPAASMTRNAITSVALPPEPVETRLPLRSAIFLTPVAVMVTTCMRLGYSTISVRTGTGLPVNLSCALVGIERRVRHGERDVGLAGADELQVGDRAAGHFRGGLHAGDILRQHGGHAAAERVVHAAGAAGGDGKVLRLGRGGKDAGGECGDAHGCSSLDHPPKGLRGNSNARRGASRPPPAAPGPRPALWNRGSRRGCPSPPAAGRSR